MRSRGRRFFWAKEAQTHASGQAADFGRDLPLFRGPALRGLCRAVLAFGLGQHADSSDDVVKNESGGPSAAALNLPWYRLELRRGADGTDLAGRSSRLAGRDGDELDVCGRATTHGLEHADVNVLTGIARRPLKAL